MRSDTEMINLHVRLLNEGTEVSRPTYALNLGGGLFKLLPTPDYNAADEEWEFVPGTVVRTQKREDENGEYLIATEA